jgi:type II restriction/modification system DNA methylase subunit YeeA
MTTMTDRQIDALVYQLYGLTEEEIKIVEGGEN